MSDCRASLRSVYVHLSRSVIRLMAVFGTAELEVMLMNIGAILILLCMFPGHIFAAVPRRSISDEQVVAQAQLAASGVYAEVYQHGVVVEPSFLKIMESAYEEVRCVTGLRLDTATLGSMVRVYVSNALGVSHVWKAYQHPSDPGVIIFLILRA